MAMNNPVKNLKKGAVTGMATVGAAAIVDRALKDVPPEQKAAIVGVLSGIFVAIWDAVKRSMKIKG